MERDSLRLTLDVLGIERADLAGWSGGGRALITFALAHPDRSLDDLTSVSCPVLLTKGTTTQPWAKRVVDVLGDHLSDAAVVELEGDHAHHIRSIDAFAEELEAHLHRDLA